MITVKQADKKSKPISTKLQIFYILNSTNSSQTEGKNRCSSSCFDIHIFILNLVSVLCIAHTLPKLLKCRFVFNSISLVLINNQWYECKWTWETVSITRRHKIKYRNIGCIAVLNFIVTVVSSAMSTTHTLWWVWNNQEPVVELYSLFMPNKHYIRAALSYFIDMHWHSY